LQRHAYRFVREKLARGEFPRGSRLSRRTLAREIGVSAGTVQIVFDQLQSEGLVTQKQGSGTYPGEKSAREMLELLELREVIEPYLAARAAQRAGVRDKRRLERICDRMEKLAEAVAAGRPFAGARRPIDRLRAAELEFHRAVLEAAGNESAMRLVSNLQIISGMMDAWSVQRAEEVARDAGLLQRICAAHRVVAEAIARNDTPAAEAAMRAHFAEGRAQLAGLVHQQSSADRDGRGDASTLSRPHIPPRRHRRNHEGRRDA
jgi:DNA-binding GntR family transcriptional regulator